MSDIRYGPYDDGPDPLAAPFDTREALDELGDRVMSGSNLRDALRDLLDRGTDRMRGLDALRRRIAERRRELQRSGRMEGILEQARELLDKAVGEERQALFPDPSDDARLREAGLDGLPDSTAGAVLELADYDWRSPEARATYQELRDLLQRDVLDQQFRGMREALAEPPDSAARQALKDMMSDLNALLEKRGRGEDTPEHFAEFMNQHGQFFPDNPTSLDGLLDSLARQAAAMARMLESLSPEQREELADLMAQAMADLDLAAQMGQLNDNLRALRPDMAWSGRQRLRGDQPLGLGDATEALADLADLDALDEAASQDYPGASIDDIDEEAVRRALGRDAQDDVAALRRLQRELEREGYLVARDGRLELSAKAIRRLGQTALRRVFASLDGSGRGDHDVADAGSSGELTGSTRRWRFGDEQPWDPVGTIRNALARDPSTGRPAPEGTDLASGSNPNPRRRGIRLAAEDIEVRETERRTRAAVALLVDQSFSMVINDTWRAAKTTAMALHALAESQFPADAIEIIAFANLARRIEPHELPDLDANEVQGTNLHHALLLAQRFLDRHRDAEPVVLVITDGEPTAHLRPDGDWYFSWPPSRETIAVTVAEVDRLTSRGTPLSFFRLGDDPALAEFLDNLARRNGGRVLAPDSDRLGDYVVSDYLRARKGRRRSA